MPRCSSMVTKTVTKERDSPISRRVTTSHRVTPSLDFSHRTSRHSAAQPASQAGRRRFDSGRPLQCSSGVTAHAVAPDATASVPDWRSLLWLSASSLLIADFATASGLGHQESHHRMVTVWLPECSRFGTERTAPRLQRWKSACTSRCSAQLVQSDLDRPAPAPARPGPPASRPTPSRRPSLSPSRWRPLSRLETSSAPVSRWLYGSTVRGRRPHLRCRRCEGPQEEAGADASMDRHSRRQPAGPVELATGGVAVAVIRPRAGSGDGAHRPAGRR